LRNVNEAVVVLIFYVLGYGYAAVAGVPQYAGLKLKTQIKKTDAGTISL
jgi:hypothetical protein